MKLQKFDIYYIFGLVITTVIMFIILLTGVYSLYVTFIIFFWVVKFLSGFGLILGITSCFLFVLNKTKDKISKRGTNVIIIFQIIIPFLLIFYAIYKLYSSYVGLAITISMTGIWADIYVWVDNIIYIYGIASLLLQLYIIPILKKEFDEAINKGRNQKWGRSFKNFNRNMKKQWLKWRGEDAKVQHLDHQSIKQLLDNWRDRFAVILLIPLAIGSLIFTPITFILIVMWSKIIIWNRTEIQSYEKITFLISIIFIGLIAIFAPFFEFGIYSSIANYLWTLNVFYLIGIIIAELIFMVKLLSLQGVSIGAYLKNRRKRKKGDLKEELEEVTRREKNN